ncbi:hypothetical protein HMPREF9420_0898 [Segatella salivae DSM 15606]|uniref:Uncharacterized protein n=1 Tax=Segatella salivae DSM 15606 TaxID=888832 RepID=E6MN30_9BACT|nr:hypothetical protein HMPREF9420_0898 [Segatella salivae DSM 15606]
MKAIKIQPVIKQKVLSSTINTMLKHRLKHYPLCDSTLQLSQ